VVSATALVAARNWLAFIPLKLPGNAIKPALLAATNTPRASAVTVPGNKK
jgi:hypothetical protein